MLRSAVSRAEQLDDEETDVVAGAVGATRSDEMDSFIAPPGKRFRMTDEYRRKRNSSPPEICEKQSKQPRLSSYFGISSREHGAPAIPTAGAGASSSARPGEERDREPRQTNKEICWLLTELQKYRRETSGALDLEVEIRQSSRLRTWPPVARMLLSPEIVSLYPGH